MPISSNRKSILLLMLANTISGVAQGITMLAIPWYFAMKDQVNLFSWLYLFLHILMVFIAPISGFWVDRYDRKRVFIFLFLGIGGIELMVSSWGWLNGQLHWSLVYLIFLLTFLSYTIHYPNLYALVQQVSPPENYGKLTSILEIQGQFSTILAGACGAILLEGVSSGQSILGSAFVFPLSIEAWSLERIFFVDGITYIISALLIYGIHFTYIHKKTQNEGDFKTRLKLGYTYLKERPALMIFGIFSLGLFATLMVETNTLLAGYVKDVVDSNASVFALAEIYYAFGALLAGFVIRSIFKNVSLPTSILFMTGLTMIGYFIMAIFHNVMYLYIYSGILGICNAGIRVQRMTFMFAVIPNAVMGRVGSIFTLSNLMMRIFLLSIISIPFFNAKAQMVYGFIVLSIFLFISMLVLLHNRKDLELLSGSQHRRS